MLIFQLLFKRIGLKQRLKKCFSHLNTSPIFGRHLIVIRLMSLRRLPDVSTISRALSQMEKDGVENVRQLSRSIVIEGLQRERLPRLTLDFDGSVQSTKGHAEGMSPCKIQIRSLLRFIYNHYEKIRQS